MNAYASIYIRVYGQQAIKSLALMQGGMNGVAASTNRATVAQNAYNNSMYAGLPRMMMMGNRLQWVGRQLQYNFTLPILIAGAAGAKWALDNEKAMTRVAKVYGDNSPIFNKLAKEEIPALGEAFEALSNQYGVQRSEVINLAADWAAAGSSGLALAKATKLTLETMILGEMEAADATQALIAIQAQYGFGIKDLSKTIDVLNMVENQTGATMADLVTAMSKAAGVARTAGVDVRHLASMVAALVPAAGTAAQAGNALKTMLSRIMAPTNEAKDVMEAMHLNISELAWQSMNGTQKLELFAKAFKGLDDAQKVVASTTVASRWQISRFDVLMRAMTDDLSYYWKGLNSTASETANVAQKQKELNMVLESSPQRLKILWTNLQNGLADIIQPLIPAILAVVGVFAQLANSFSKLSPEVQKFIATMLVLLALVGPFIRYLGAIFSLFSALHAGLKWLTISFFGFSKIVTVAGKEVTKLGLSIAGLKAGYLAKGLKVIGTAIKMFLLSPFMLLSKMFSPLISAFSAFASRIALVLLTAGPLKAIGAALISPWGLALAAIIALVIIFRKQIVKLFQSMIEAIIKAFNALPVSVKNVFISIARFIANIAKQIWEFLSYINPFARHSPSLVDSVTAGVAIIAEEYAKLGNLGPIFEDAAADIERFKKATTGIAVDEFATIRTNLAKIRPIALPNFDELIADLKELNDLIARQEELIKNQEAVVEKWKIALEAANAELDKQQNLLDELEAKATSLSDAIDRATSAIQDYAKAPIQGMQEMSDAIFQNELEAKKLQLAIMQWEDANGTIDDIRQNLALLQGDIESAQGEAADLRTAGAGSEILGPIQAQISAMQTQYKAVEKAVADSPVLAMQQQLDALNRQAEELELEQAIKFDPLTRQIDQLANSMEELPFDTIIAGIQREQQAIATLTPQLDAVNQQIAAQKVVVDQATAARDQIQQRYDLEQKLLDQLQASYQQTGDAINQVTDALQALGSAAEAALSKAASAATSMGTAASNFAAGEGANWEDVGGLGKKIGREGGMTSKAPDIKDWIDKDLKGLQDYMSGLDLFGPLKKAWNKAWTWIKDNTAGLASKVWDAVVNFFSGMGNPFEGWDLGGKFSRAWDSVVNVASNIWDKIWGAIGGPLSLLGDDISRIWNTITDGIKRAIHRIAPQFKTLGTVVEPLKAVWNGLIELFKSVGNWIVDVAKILWPVITKTVDILGKFLMPVLKSIAAFLGGVFLTAFHMVVAVISNVFVPIWNNLVEIIARVVQIIIGIIRTFIGLFTGDFGTFLSGLWQIVNGVLGAIFNIFSAIFGAIYGVVRGVIESIIDTFQWFYKKSSIVREIVDFIIEIFKLLISIPKWIWDNVLQPIWNFFKTAWTNYIWPAVKAIVDGVWNFFKGLGAIGVWVWENVLKPIWNFFVSAWTNYIWPAVKAIADGVWNGFKGLLGVARWIWDNVLQPVINFFSDLWNKHLKGILQILINGAYSAWNAVGGAIATGVNIGIKAINALIGAINWVGSHLPGLSFKVSTLSEITYTAATAPRLASGGRVGSGFVTNGPTAIVGEGNRAYPEYVIPTDPKYRNNALRLLSNLVDTITGRNRLEAGGSLRGGLPRLQFGGLLDVLREGAVKAVFAGPLLVANQLIGMIKNKWTRDAFTDLKNTIYNWALGKEKAIIEAQAPVIGALPSMTTTPGMATRRENDLITAVQTLTSGPGMTRREWSAAGAVLSLADGGYIRRRTGGTLVRVGEGRYDEVVVPITRAFNRMQQTSSVSSRSETREIHFHGDLVFPNIENGNDAKDFIRNLEALVRD